MNKNQKLVQQQFLNNEEAVIARLKSVYGASLRDIKKKAKALQDDINSLDAMMNLTDDAEEKATLLSRKQAKIYQKQYQDALQKQVGSILDNMQVEEFKTVSEYLQKCYEDGFIGTMFDLQGQGIPLCFPLDQESIVRAVQLDSKISTNLYTRLGQDITLMKKRIAAQVSRGISTGMTFAQVAQQLDGQTNIGFNNAVRIARTEGHRIQTQAGMDACTKAKEKGADVVKQWDSTMDKRTRKSHQHVDGEIRELDEAFSNGLMFPGDPDGGAAEVINCRCALLQRARWALDEEELNTLKERAEYFGLDKAESFEDYKQKYLKAAENLTKNEKSGIIPPTNSNDEATFDNIIGNQKGITQAYQDALNQKYASGTDTAKKVFNKFVPSDSVASAAYNGTPHFSPTDGKVYMNFSDDLVNSRGAGTTFFHEHGHYIDFMSAGSKNHEYLSTNNRDFGDLLKSDFKNYVKSVKKTHNIKYQNDAYYQISRDIFAKGDIAHSVSDLMGGMSGNKARAGWGHRTSYWKYSGALEKEAFAHMFEAQFNKEKYNLMKQYFPNALSEFENMIKGLI